MSLARSLATGLAVASSLLLTLGGLALPAAAADSPEAAGYQILEMMESGDRAAIDTSVCEAQRDVVRAQLDSAATLGLELGLEDAELAFRIDDPAVEVVSQESDTAVIRMTATMTIETGGVEVEELARELIEADMGEDVSEADVEMALPFLTMLFDTPLPVDEELDLVREGGEWLVCGDLGEPEEPVDGFGSDYVIEPSVSSDGLCRVASPEDMSALGALEYDSSEGFESDCTYWSSDFEDYHSTTVSLELGQQAQEMASWYSADEQIDVDGHVAFVTLPDPASVTLLTQAGDDTLVIDVALPADGDADAGRAQATTIAELFLPALDEVRAELTGPDVAAATEVSLCESLSLDELNSATGLGFDTLDGDSGYCSAMSIDGEPGSHFVTLFVSDLTLDDYRTWLLEPTDAEIAGQPALLADSQVIVGLPDGQRVIDLSLFLDTADDSLSVTELEVAAAFVEPLLPVLTAD